MIKPIEFALSEIKSVIVRDSAVDAMCHGAQLAIPGILQISPNLKKGDIVGIYTQKGEIIRLLRTQQINETDHDIIEFSTNIISKIEKRLKA